MRVLLFISSLQTGGAERQFVSIAEGLARRGHEVIVATLYSEGAFSARISNNELVSSHVLIPVRSKFRLARIAQVAVAALTLRRLIASVDPEIIYSMLHLTNLIARIAVGKNRKPLLIWGNRASNVERNRKLWLAEWCCARFSRGVSALISNSYAGMKRAEAIGFAAKKSLVIENGVDTQRFRRSDSAADRFRKAYSIHSHAFLIGIVGRLDPMKDHLTFLKAAALVARTAENAIFLCVGDTRNPEYTTKLHRYCGETGLSRRTIWLDGQDDLVPVYSALNVLVSSSAFGEGFSNVVAEAMACEVFCVVSDVGDSGRLVADTGLTFSSGNEVELSDALLRLWKMGVNRSPRCRERVARAFAQERCIDKTEAAMLSLLACETDAGSAVSSTGAH